MKTQVLAFSGPDGTGKTSCANILSRILFLRNYGVIHVWIKISHGLAFLIVRLLEKIDSKHVIRSTSGTLITNSLSKNTSMWLLMELGGVLVKILVMRINLIVLRLISRKPVIAIADRFLLDTIVHLAISKILSDQENLLSHRILILLNHPAFKILRSILLKCSFTIYLDGQVTELIQRNARAGKADPYWYMVLQKYLYRISVKALDIHYLHIDTSMKTLNEVCMEVLARLNGEKVIEY
jgi:hypothetical protein